MTRWRLIVGVAIPAALVIVLVAVLAGRGGNSDLSEREQPRAAMTTATPSTEPKPNLETRGSDFKQVWTAISDFYGWLAKHPDPTLVDEIFDRSCPCFEDELRAQRRLRRNGWRYAGEDTYQTLGVRLVRRLTRDAVLISVVDRESSQVVIDQSGRVVEKGVGWPPTEWHFTLLRGSDGRWRIGHVVEMGKVKAGRGAAS